MNTLIIGHSFVLRLNAYLHSPPHSHLLQNTQNHHITCIGKGGCYISGNKYNLLRHETNLHLSNTNTQTLIISLGTNDLDSGVPPYKVARCLYSMACGLQIRFHIRYVFIEQILDRDAVQYPGFHQLVQDANDKIQALVDQGANKSVRFWKHHNFAHPKRRLLLRDGVHFNQVGMARYWRSLRGAILYAERH